MSAFRRALSAFNRQNQHAQNGKRGDHEAPRADKGVAPSKLAKAGRPDPYSGIYNLSFPIHFGGYPSLTFTIGGDVADASARESDLPHRRTSEPVVGWRAWRLSKDERGEPVLLSAVKETEWAGPVFRADKKPGLGDNHGVHAFRRTYMNTEYRGCTVEGEVLLFGKTIVFEKGIRAEAAMIRRLVLFPGGWAPMEEDPFTAAIRAYKQAFAGSGYSILSCPSNPEPAKPRRRVHAPNAREKCGVEETTALMEALAKRYDCEVTLGQVVTPADLAPEKPRRLARRARLIRKPTKDEINRFSNGGDRGPR